MTIRFSRNQNRHNDINDDEENVGVLLMPSSSFFEKLEHKVSINALNEEISALIVRRENLISSLQSTILQNHDEVQNEIKDSLRELHAASIRVVEAVIIGEITNCDQSKERKATHERPLESSEKVGQSIFSWNGENYLIKMLTDLQFIDKADYAIDIIGRGKNSLYRNPFILPFDVDEIVSLNSGDSLELSNMTEAIPWEVNIEAIIEASKRILREEKARLDDSRTIIKVSRSDGVGDNMIELISYPFPKIHSEQLHSILLCESLTFDEALVVYCVWLLIVASHTYQDSIQTIDINRSVIYSVVQKQLDDILDRLQAFTNNPVKIIVSKNAVIVIHSMILRHLLKVELLLIKSNRSLVELKLWLLSMVSKSYTFATEIEEIAPFQPYEELYGAFDQVKIDDCLKASGESTGKTQVVPDNDDLVVPNKSYWEERKRRLDEKATEKDYTPMPIWCILSANEGDYHLNVVEGSVHESLKAGDRIRIGHPLHSYNYTIRTNENELLADKSCIYITEPFDYSPVLRERYKEQDDTIEVLHDPHFRKKQKEPREEKFHPLKSVTVLHPNSHMSFDDAGFQVAISRTTERDQLSFSKIRIWKLVRVESDKRLQWRKYFDHGFVSWVDLPRATVKCEQFRVSIKVADIEEDCFDSISNPYQHLHKQRLQYFEKVALEKIMVETYTAVCNWHPVSSSIDIFKWAKLARNMKFLSRVKNANHKVDMAFLRHSSKRTLDLYQFQSILLDMASVKFPSSRYDSREGLANMLWSTVAIIPAVNTMIWREAQQMAVQEEILRICAQTRIAARIRMLQYTSRFRKMRFAAINIQIHTRRRCCTKRRRERLLRATYDRIYRIRYLSSIICQKNWRRYLKRRQFKIYQKQRKTMLQECRAKRRKKMQMKFKQKMRPVVHRQIIRIQSLLTVMWTILRDRRIHGLGIEIELQVYVPQDRRTFYFCLSENKIRCCFENEILRTGPRSWDKILEPNTISQLSSRLSVQSIDGKITIEFKTSGIVETGDLIANRFVCFNTIKYVLSMYRSSTNIVIRLFDPDRDLMLRDEIELSLLLEWLAQDDAHKRTGIPSATKYWEFVQRRKEQESTSLHHGHFDASGVDNDGGKFDYYPSNLFKKSKESVLISWLITNISIRQNKELGNYKIIFGYELEAEQLEKIARNIQSIWRGKCAKNKAKEEVYAQYERQFDRESRSFFYVHIKTGNTQWSKPAALSDEEDVDEPADEWRESECLDPESNTIGKYYFNPLTGQTSWLSEEEAARMLQRKFRARQTQELLNTNLDFRQAAKAIRFTNDVESKYEQNPKKLSNIVNFALLNHCIKSNLEIATALYDDAIAKSPYHPVISRAYGIFILATCKAPISTTFEKACRFFKEASAIDPLATKFQTATENFFYWSVVTHPNDSFALLNYALLHQCILGEYYRTEKIYRRALSESSNDDVLVANYNLFLDQRYPGGYYASNSVPNVVVRRSETKEERPDWGEWKIMTDPFCTKQSFSDFWLNSVDGTSSFKEPDWEMVWSKRVERSKIISERSECMWIEYYDQRLEAKFVFNKTTKQYVWMKRED